MRKARRDERASDGDPVTIPLMELRADPRNVRRHTAANVALLEQSLEEVGAARSIVIDETGTVLAGNATLKAAQAKGIERVRIIDTDGRELVAVRRTGLTADEKVRLAVFDNRTAELAEWDEAALERLLAESPHVLDELFDSDELEALLRNARTDEQGGVDAEPQIDKAEELREQWGTERGQLWQLGEHRLYCGDATNADDVATVLGGAKPLLMVTDPPYGIEYDPNWRNEAAEAGHISYAARATGKVANDDRADWGAAYALFPGDIAYVWHAGIRSSEVQDSLERCGFQVRAQIVWNKSHMVISRGHYHGKHEPCFYSVRDKATASWAGDRSQMTVWDISNQQADHTVHGTQKPVECMRRPIQNHGGKDDAVYDPFCGSGTTIIACEQVGRRCFALEIEPGYVAVALQRYAEATGKTPVQVDA